MKKYIKLKNIILAQLLMISVSSLAQTPLVGRVVNQNNEPIKGAVIISTYSKKEIVSGKDGTFLTQELGDVDSLAVNADGYAVTKVFFKKSEELTVVIRPVDYWEANVPIFWGRQTRKFLTGSYDRLNTRDLGASPTVSLLNIFGGRVPSIATVQSSSLPGFEDPNVGIRGIGSSGTNTLNTFVDGYNRDYSNLDPEEIEEMVFLKDAASIAQFGISGANRGIYVVTKRGKAFQNKITFHSQVGFQKPTRLPKFLESYDYATLYNEARANDGLTPFYTDAAIKAYADGSDPYLYPNVDWQKELIKDNSSLQRHTLSLQGGNNSARYFVMMGYLQQSGLFKYGDINKFYNTSTGYQRYNFRSNFDLNINKYLSVLLDLSGRIDARNGPANGELRAGTNEVWANIALYPPTLFPIINKDGSIGGNNSYLRNPYGLITRTGYRQNQDRYFQGRIKAEGNLDFLLEGLKTSLGFSYNNYLQSNRSQTQTFAVFEYRGDAQPYIKYGNSTVLGGSSASGRFDTDFFLDADITHNKKVGKNSFDSQIKYWQSSTFPAGENNPYLQQQLSARFTYVYNEKYVAEGFLSYSGSGEFAPGKQFGVFPTASGAWIVSNENFLKNSKAINFLKIRGSYGILGNDNVGFGVRYPFVEGAANSGAGGASFGFTPAGTGGVAEARLSNPNASWETGILRNVGLDAEFFNQAIKLSVDYFRENRNGIVNTPTAISGLLGAPAIPSLNIGKVLNRGFDIDVTFRKNINKNASVFLRALGSYYKNTRLYFDEEVKENEWEKRTGKQVSQPFGLTFDGFFKNQAEIDAAAKSSYRAVLKPGDIRYKDLNGDKLIDFRDFTAMGYNASRPEINYGITIGGNYKSFEVMVLFHGVAHSTVFLNGNGAFSGFYNGAKPTNFIMNRWTPTNMENATFPRLTTITDQHNYQTSDFWIRNSSFVRLKNVEVSYTIPTTVASRLRLQGMRVYLNGNNLNVWDKIKTVDPEGPNAGVGVYPITSTMNIGLRVEI